MSRLRLPSRALLALTALALPVLPAAAAGEEAAVGRVKVTTGEAFVVRAEERKAAEIGDPVHRGDALETGTDGALGVVFRDESRISLGADTRLVVDEYVYAPERQEGSFLARMTRGTLLFVSGLISKLSPDSTEVETPAGILGVRGTRFLIYLEAPEE